MEWEKDKKVISEFYFEKINLINIELFGRIKEHLEIVKPVFPLLGFIISRFDTVTLLAQEDRLWDAEIIERSGIEALVKLMFIVNDADQKDIRINEFWNDLCEINKLKFSEHAKKHIGQYKDEFNYLAHIALILSEDEEKQLREKWTKANRQKIEQKWSFSQILASLRNDYLGQPNELLLGLAHTYRIGSHLTHGDETGILIINERESRNEEDKNDAERSHFIRLMSDSLSYCMMAAVSIMTLTKQDPQYFFDLHNERESIETIVAKYGKRSFQDTDYDKFRKDSYN